MPDMHYNSGDAVAMADDPNGLTHYQTIARCQPISPMGARCMKASNALHDFPVNGVRSSLPFFSTWARWAFNREWMP